MSEFTPDQATAKAEQPSGRRECFEGEFQLAPESLVGSWFLRVLSDEITHQGMVVAEPQAGVYLVEYIDPVNAQLAYQQVVPIQMMVDDGDGGWRFYDTQHQMINAAAEHRLREVT